MIKFTFLIRFTKLSSVPITNVWSTGTIKSIFFVQMNESLNFRDALLPVKAVQILGPVELSI